MTFEKEMEAIKAQKAKLAEQEKNLKKKMAAQAEKNAAKLVKKYGIADATQLLELATSIGHEEALKKLAPDDLPQTV